MTILGLLKRERMAGGFKEWLSPKQMICWKQASLVRLVVGHNYDYHIKAQENGGRIGFWNTRD